MTPIEAFGKLRCGQCGGPLVTGEGFLRCAVCGSTIPLAKLGLGLTTCKDCGRKKKSRFGEVCQHCRAQKAKRDERGLYIEETGDFTPEMAEYLRSRQHPTP